MALHVAFFLHNRLVRIIEGGDNRGPDNQGSTVMTVIPDNIAIDLPDKLYTNAVMTE